MKELILVRHGRSAHVETRWLTVEGLREWMVAYDAAEILVDFPPPAELRAAAERAARIVASDLPRAAASARMLAPDRPIEQTALLREAPMETAGEPLPALGGLRLPLGAWALVFGARWVASKLRGAPPPGVDAATLARAERAAAWLETQAGAAGGSVLVVTHATFRLLLARALARRGWRGPERRPFREWSAWQFESFDEEAPR